MKNKKASFVGKASTRDSNLNTRADIASRQDVAELLRSPWSPFAQCETNENGSTKSAFSTLLLSFDNSKWTFEDGIKWAVKFSRGCPFRTAPLLVLMGPNPDFAIGFDENTPNDFFISFFLPFCSTDSKFYRLLEMTLEQLVPCKRRAEALSVPVVTRAFSEVFCCWIKKNFFVTDFDEAGIFLKEEINTRADQL